jgi:stringent starvation protein B
MTMGPLKPYLIRAVYDWIVDHDMTPHLVLDAEAEGVIVPTEFIQEGRIVLNLRPAAVQGLHMGNDRIEFDARFAGRPMRVGFPVAAVLGLFAKENGRGMAFGEEDPGDDVPPAPDTGKPARPALKLVK